MAALGSAYVAPQTRNGGVSIPCPSAFKTSSSSRRQLAAPYQPYQQQTSSSFASQTSSSSKQQGSQFGCTARSVPAYLKPCKEFVAQPGTAPTQPECISRGPSSVIGSRRFCTVVRLWWRDQRDDLDDITGSPTYPSDDHEQWQTLARSRHDAVFRRPHESPVGLAEAGPEVWPILTPDPAANEQRDAHTSLCRNQTLCQTLHLRLDVSFVEELQVIEATSTSAAARIPTCPDQAKAPTSSSTMATKRMMMMSPAQSPSAYTRRAAPTSLIPSTARAGVVRSGTVMSDRLVSGSIGGGRQQSTQADDNAVRYGYAPRDAFGQLGLEHGDRGPVAPRLTPAHGHSQYLP
ncbi:hypothetical protein V8E36_000748 [Tilletia maclaganii]